MCQKEGWAPKGWARGGALTRMLGLEWVNWGSHVDWRRMSVSEDAGPWRGWIKEIPHRLKNEWVSAKTLSFKEVNWGVGPTSIGEGNKYHLESRASNVWIVRSHIDCGGELNIISKCLKTSPYEMRFKAFEGNQSSKKTIFRSSGLGGWIIFLLFYRQRAFKAIGVLPDPIPIGGDMCGSNNHWRLNLKDLLQSGLWN